MKESKALLTLKLLYKFFGGVYFAILLIALAAIFVITGTVIESKTGSHLFAAKFTYSHPLFSFLLFLFFVNILLSTLRRWPFQKKHIPFIITHIGLLLILSGQIVKSRFGLQGTLILKEGSASSTVLLPGTLALNVDTKEKNYLFELESDWKNNPTGRLKIDVEPPFKAELTEFWPNAEFSWQHYIQKDKLHIAGVSPIEVKKWKKSMGQPKAFLARLHHENSPVWHIRAALVDNLEEAIQELYLEELDLKLFFGENAAPIFDGKLKSALNSDLNTFKVDFHHQEPLQRHPELFITDKEGRKWSLELSSSSFLNLKAQGVELKPFEKGLSVEISSPRRIYFLSDGLSTIAFAVDNYGRYFSKLFSGDKLESFISYDDGFLGYYDRLKIPFPAFESGPSEIKAARLYEIGLQLREALAEKDGLEKLSFPLKVFAKASKHFEKDFLEFISLWEEGKTWLFPIESPISQELLTTLQNLEEPIPQKLLERLKKFEKKLADKSPQAALSLALRLYGICPESLLGKPEEDDFNEIIKNHLAAKHYSKQVSQNLKELKGYSLAEKAAFLESFPIDAEKAVFIKRACKEYLELTNRKKLDIKEITIPASASLLKQEAPLDAKGKINPDDLKSLDGVIEAPLAFKLDKKPPSSKIEEDIPVVTVLFKDDESTEKIRLPYDSTASNLKWPSLEGRVKARFQPVSISIPYRLRLKEAKKIDYPHSNQPYSYESDLYIKGPDGQIVETTLSMNRVFETWDGYRFYLSSLYPQEEGKTRSVQIVVNRDPGKYWLTYPGALLLFTGILLLFFVPKRRN